MSDMVDFFSFLPEREPDEMSRTELADCLEATRAQLARLDECEPEEMDSEAYDTWADHHETLEDLVDELLDRLDELGGSDD